MNDICDMHVQSLIRVLSLRDVETEQHTLRVAAIALGFARMWGVSKQHAAHIYHGALLHDIGKLGIPDGILHKNGPLTDEERVIMQMHPVYAERILSKVSCLGQAVDIPYCHHEKWDGTGYPRGLRGTQIPFAARMFAILDVWDALVSNRPYRTAWTREQAFRYLRQQSGRHFDPKVVMVFGEFLGKMEGCIGVNRMLALSQGLLLRQEAGADSVAG